ncbi:MAG: hypothetical protein ACOC1E_00030 [Marinilabiliaceae bacterium]
MDVLKYHIVKFHKSSLILLVVCFLVSAKEAGGQQSKIPHLRDHGDTTQLMVDGASWLMIAGELGNSREGICASRSEIMIFSE